MRGVSQRLLVLGLIGIKGTISSSGTVCDSPACFGSWLEAIGALSAREMLETAGYDSPRALVTPRVISEDVLKGIGLGMKLRKRLIKGLAAESDRLAAARLWRPDGVKVGHRQELVLEDDRFVVCETLSMQPLLFRLENYLTPEEVTALMDVALRKQLSRASIFPRAKGANQTLVMEDVDGDGAVSLHELLLTFDRLANAHLSLDDVSEIIGRLGVDADGDGSLSQQELRQYDLQIDAVADQIKQLLQLHPQKRSRHSETVRIFVSKQCNARRCVYTILTKIVIAGIGVGWKERRTGGIYIAAAIVRVDQAPEYRPAKFWHHANCTLRPGRTVLAAFGLRSCTSAALWQEWRSSLLPLDQIETQDDAGACTTEARSGARAGRTRAVRECRRSGETLPVVSLRDRVLFLEHRSSRWWRRDGVSYSK